MDHGDLRSALLDLAPSPLAAVDRAAVARSRARRSRNRRVVIVAVAAVVAAIAIPVTVLGEREPTPAQPAAAPEISCPASKPADRLPPSSFAGTGTVPTGAVGVRLCFPGGPNPWEPPRDLLVQGADTLARQINAVAVNPYVANGERSCTLRLGIDWGFQFGYPDGSTNYVQARTGGCAGIQVGVTTRGTARDAMSLYQAFRDALLEQRAATEPPAPRSGGALPEKVPCPGTAGWRSTWITLVGQPDRVPQFERAAVCRFFGSEERDVSELSPSEVESLNADLRLNSGPLAPPGRLTTCEGPLAGYAIAGHDGWGDSIVLRQACGKWEVGHRRYWNPSPDFIEALSEHTRFPPLSAE